MTLFARLRWRALTLIDWPVRGTFFVLNPFYLESMITVYSDSMNVAWKQLGSLLFFLAYFFLLLFWYLGPLLLFFSSSALVLMCLSSPLTFLSTPSRAHLSLCSL